MNCKQGDLAVILHTWPIKEERGAFVEVLRAGCNEELIMRNGFLATCRDGPAWLCDSRITTDFPCFIADEFLRPIRESDGEDEMLRLAGKPHPIGVKA